MQRAHELRAKAITKDIPAAFRRAVFPLQNAIVRCVQRSQGSVDPCLLATAVGAGEMTATQAAPFIKWAGASLAAAKSTWMTAILVELGATKTVDYQLTKRLRRPGGAGAKLYTAMSRAGLEAGWRADGTTLPWWYGAVSYGATGCIDFMVAQALGSQLRSQFDSHPEVARLRGGSKADQARLARLESAFFERGVEEVASRLEDPKGGAQSPLTRHLLGALRGQHDPKLRATVERRLATKTPGDAALGTMGGHAATGGLVGTMLGDPLLGLLVGAVDASADAAMTRAALKGRFATLAKMKASLLKQGWDGDEGKSMASLASDFYAPVGGEFRDLGRDLRNLLDTNAKAMASSPQPALESWLDARLGPRGTEQPAALDTKQWFDGLVAHALGGVSEHLSHHAAMPMREALSADFPQTADQVDGFVTGTKVRMLAHMMDSLEPGPTIATDRYSDSHKREEASASTIDFGMLPEGQQPKPVYFEKQLV